MSFQSEISQKPEIVREKFFNWMVEYLSDSEYAKFQEGTISGFGDIMVLRRQDKAK